MILHSVITKALSVGPGYYRSCISSFYFKTVLPYSALGREDLPCGRQDDMPLARFLKETDTHQLLLRQIHKPCFMEKLSFEAKIRKPETKKR